MVLIKALLSSHAGFVCIIIGQIYAYSIYPSIKTAVTDAITAGQALGGGTGPAAADIGSKKRVMVVTSDMHVFIERRGLYHDAPIHLTVV